MPADGEDARNDDGHRPSAEAGDAEYGAGACYHDRDGAGPDLSDKALNDVEKSSMVIANPARVSAIDPS